MTFHAVLIVILHFTGFCSGMALPNPTAEDLDDTVPLLARSLEGNHRLVMRHFLDYRVGKDGGNSSVGGITVEHTDMENEMKQEAIAVTEDAFEQFTVEEEIENFIKNEFEEKYGNTWTCIVGRKKGSYVTHETNEFIFMRAGQVDVLLYRSG